MALTLQELKKMAKSRGGKCLSKSYKDRQSELKWQCSQGHQWESAPRNILRGSWCPICIANARPNFIEAKQVAESKGGQCLSAEYTHHSVKLQWQCVQGHQWKATAYSVKRGSWCPHCAGLAPKSIEDMQELAAFKGGKCLSKSYKGRQFKLQWQCAQGHQWKATPRSVQKGSWCPVCSANLQPVFIEAKQIAELKGGQCLSKNYIRKRSKLRWRCSEGHRWEETASGIKHGSWCPYCSGKAKSIKDMKVLAKAKGGKCLSKEYVNSRSKLKWQCSKKHQWEASHHNISRGGWCPSCAGRPKIYLEDVKALAKQKGGKCLSKEYINSRTKLRWQCSEGHEWEATLTGVKQGSWCPRCSVCPKIYLEDVKALAKGKGGKCLSRKYVNALTKMRWQCSEGHKWDSTLSNVKAGSWCKECKKKRKKQRLKSYESSSL